MTENDAKTKWCPMVRAVNFEFANENQNDDEPLALIQIAGAVHNRIVIDSGPESDDPLGWDNAHLKCIGTACMMWRWTPRFTGNEQQHPDSGYCGLAGKPC